MIAGKNSISVSQVLLSWAVQRGTSVVPKSSQPKHIRANLELSKLSEPDTETINSIKQEGNYVRFLDPKDYLGFDVFNEEADEPIADKSPWKV